MDVVFQCDECGWGSERDEKQDTRGSKVQSGSLLFLLKFFFFWALSLLIVTGPYVGLRYAAGYFADFFGTGEAEWLDGFIKGLNIHYPWLMGAYIFLAHFISPEYDKGKMGIFGAGRIANPALTRDHHYNRAMYSLESLLGPGRIVAATLAASWRLIIGKR